MPKVIVATYYLISGLHSDDRRFIDGIVDIDFAIEVAAKFRFELVASHRNLYDHLGLLFRIALVACLDLGLIKQLKI